MFQIDTLILFVFGLGLPKTRVIQFGQWAV